MIHRTLRTSPSRVLLLAGGAAGLALAAGIASAQVPPAGAPDLPGMERRPASEPWRVACLSEDAGLDTAAVFTIDFEADGTAWLAASDGLYRTDGYRWERFGTETGLPSEYVRCATVTCTGTLWVGTDRGAGTFDGERFTPAEAGGLLADKSVRRIVDEADGSLWFSCDGWPDPTVSGGLVRFAEGEWSELGVGEGLPTDYVADLVLDRRGRRLALTRRGLVRVEGDRCRPVWSGLSFANSWAWDLVDSPSVGLLVSTDAGFVVERDGWRLAAPSPGPNAKLGLTADGDVLTCLPSEGFRFARWTGAELEPLTEPARQRAGSVEMVREAPDGAVWAVGLGTVLRWERRGGEWERLGGVPELIAMDGSDAVWFAGADRVVRWGREGPATIPGARSPLSLGGRDAWMRRGDGLARWRDGELELHPAEELGLRWPRRVHTVGEGLVWVLGPGSGGAADEREAAAFYDGAWRRHPDLGLGGGRIRDVATGAGGDLWLLVAEGEPERNRLVAVGPDGPRRIPLPAWAERDSGLQVRTGSSGPWVFGFGGLVRYDAGAEGWIRVDGHGGGHVFSVVERDDELWVAATGATGGRSSVSVLRDGSWTQRPASVQWLAGFGADGLSYAIPRGLLQVEPGGGSPTLFPVPTEEPIRRAVSLASGEVWLQLERDVLHFRPDGVPPRAWVVDAPRSITAREDLVLTVAAVERFRPRSHAAEALRVETRFDGGAWTDRGPLGDGRLRVERPAGGEHRLEIRVLDPARDAGPPTAVSFRVQPTPLQERRWFLPAVLAVLAAMAALALLALAGWRRVGRQAGELEDQVEQRTAALGASERRYRGLFEQTHEAILLVDERDRVVHANRAAAALVGLSEDRLAGQALGSLFLTAPDGLASVPAAALAGEGSRELEVRTHDGRSLTLVGRGQALVDAEGRTRERQVILEDVTERRRIEERLRDAQKIEAVGRLAAGVAHEFNNLLTVLVGHTELLERELEAHGIGLENVRRILEQAHRARAITSRIQGFSREEALESRLVHLDSVVGGATELLAASIGARFELEVDLGAEGALVLVDALKLEQVLINLVLNARDASPAGGRIRVATSREDRAVPACAVLAVTDRGSGMDAATQERIFEPFFTTKPRGQGTGLGLAIVHDVVEQFGGTIEVESEPRSGTTIRVRLPTVAGEPAHDVLRPAPQAPGRGGRGAILVVEDEPQIRDLLERILEGAGYEVVLAGDSEAALRQLRERAFDLVLSDVVLPGTSGVAFAERLEHELPDLPVVLMSGYSPLDAPPLPRRRLVSKPFAPAELLEVVRSELGGERSGALR